MVDNSAELDKTKTTIQLGRGETDGASSQSTYRGKFKDESGYCGPQGHKVNDQGGDILRSEISCLFSTYSRGPGNQKLQLCNLD